MIPGSSFRRARLISGLLLFCLARAGAAGELPLVAVLDEQAAELADKIAGAFKPETSSPTVALAEARLVGVSTASIPLVKAFERHLAARLSRSGNLRLVEGSAADYILEPTVIALGGGFLVSAQMTRSGGDGLRLVAFIVNEEVSAAVGRRKVKPPRAEAGIGESTTTLPGVGQKRASERDERFGAALIVGQLRQVNGTHNDFGVSLLVPRVPLDVVIERVSIEGQKETHVYFPYRSLAAYYRIDSTIDRIKALYRFKPFPIGRRALSARVGGGLALIHSDWHSSEPHNVLGNFEYRPESGSLFVTRPVLEASLHYALLDRFEVQVAYERTFAGSTVVTAGNIDYGLEGFLLRLSYRIW